MLPDHCHRPLSLTQVINSAFELLLDCCCGTFWFFQVFVWIPFSVVSGCNWDAAAARHRLECWCRRLQFRRCQSPHKPRLYSHEVRAQCAVMSVHPKASEKTSVTKSGQHVHGAPPRCVAFLLQGLEPRSGLKRLLRQDRMHGRIGCCSRNSLSAIMWHGFKLLCDMISNSLFQPVTATHVRRNRWNPYVPWSEESVTARELGLSAIPKYSSYLRPATFDLSDASFRWRMAQQRCSNSILTICCRGESVPIVLLPVKGYLTSPERHSVKATSKDCWCDLCDREGKKEVMMVTEQ